MKDKTDKPQTEFKTPSYLEANPISRISQWYLNPLFRQGYKRRLELEDVPKILPWDESAHLGSRLEGEWNNERKKKKPYLAFVLLRLFRLPIITYGVIQLFVEGLKICQPLLINLLLDYFQGRGVSKGMAYVYGTLLALCGIIFAFPAAAAFQMSWCVGMRARAAACALIFRKMMSMKMQKLSETASGEILNYMATDVEKFQMGVIMIHFTWIGPLEMIVVSTLLFLEFGLAFLGGLGVAVLVIVFQQVTSRFYGKLRLRIAKYADRRTHLMNEIIAGMRVIKMYCWETPYTKIIAGIRKKEIRKGIQAGLLETQNFTISSLSAKLVTFVTIVIYVTNGNVLTPQKIFKLVAWMEILRYSVFFALTGQMLMGSQAYFSAQRIQKFLDSETVEHDSANSGNDKESYKKIEEVDMNDTKEASSTAGPEDFKISLSDVTATWSIHTNPNFSSKKKDTSNSASSSKVFSLSNLNLHVKQGELVACVGSVGSGKSSLLLTLLGQMPVTSGNVIVNGDMAYVPQEAWVFSGSFRENILFGSPMDQRQYEEVLGLCALLPDIDQMPSGDLSLVGERGLSLSGGQKARLNLARAVYRDADVYLFDDPLSAVDIKVGKHLFQKCICDHLKDKTRLLITHQLQYLKQVDRIIVLQNGSIHASGTFKELEGKVDFSHLLEKDEEATKAKEKVANYISEDTLSSYSSRTGKSGREAELAALSDMEVNVLSTEDVAMIEEEERLKGHVGFGVYQQYWRAGKGAILFTLLFILLVASTALYVFVDWWLARWATWYIDEFEHLYNVSDHKDGFVPSESYDYMLVYACLVAVLFVVSAVGASVFVMFTRLAARTLHNNMFSIVMRAPLAFFERNPVGRVLNRFSRDMIFIDEIMPYALFIVMTYLMLSLGMVIFVSIVNPWALLFTLPLVIVIIAVRQYGAHTTRDVKRIEALNRSPVYSHVTATLQGMSVIRAFKMEDLMTREFDQLQDRHTSAWFAFLSCYRWLGIRFDWITGFYLTFTVFVSLLLSDTLDGTLVGLSLTYIFSMLGALQFVVRQTAEVESYMTSVERILQYTKLEQEAPPHKDDVPLPPDWPTKGDITFDHITVAYIEDAAPALNDVCITIHGGEKIGVVGRTGAGKSSLIAALMRLVEPKGSIWIDGVDITTIGLEDLRKKVSIIPQDPVLFTGTLRVNLDPFSEYTDDQLWQAVEEVQLKEKIEQLPGQLYGEIAEAGSNFSVGQKQLVCLARALLRQNKLLLIDEATANVDQSTDDLIQKTLRTKFKDCTVLTVAHRLNTIMDSDKVLVLEQGKVKQFDHPFILLQQQSSHFDEMVKQTGRTYSHSLLMIAENKYNQDCISGKLLPIHEDDDGGSSGHEENNEEGDANSDRFKKEN